MNKLPTYMIDFYLIIVKLYCRNGIKQFNEVNKDKVCCCLSHQTSLRFLITYEILRFQFITYLLNIYFQISRGYNETVTIFYIHIIAYAITKSDHNEQNFEDFISHNKHIEAKDLLFKYYSPEVIQNKDSATRLVIFVLIISHSKI